LTIDQAQKEENTAKKMQILKYKRQNMCEMLKNTPKPSKNTKKGVKYLKNAKTAQNFTENNTVGQKAQGGRFFFA